jgi:hypothetical protein
VIAHIVLFSPKPGLSDDDKRLFAQFLVRTLKSNPGIARSRVGRMVSVDPGYERSMGDKTYEYAAVLEFEDRIDLVDYLAADSHAELGRLFWSCCERSVVSEVEYVDLKAETAVDLLVR